MVQLSLQMSSTSYPRTIDKHRNLKSKYQDHLKNYKLNSHVEHTFKVHEVGDHIPLENYKQTINNSNELKCGIMFDTIIIQYNIVPNMKKKLNSFYFTCTMINARNIFSHTLFSKEKN
jgi:hypothetical protein